VVLAGAEPFESRVDVAAAFENVVLLADSFLALEAPAFTFRLLLSRRSSSEINLPLPLVVIADPSGRFAGATVVLLGLSGEPDYEPR
jgi:hypothetical protein